MGDEDQIPPSDAQSRKEDDAVQADSEDVSNDTTAPARTDAEAPQSEPDAADAPKADEVVTADRSDASDAEEVPKTDEATPLSKDRSFWYWAGGIAAILCLELFIYGHDAEIEVCVGVEGVTQWELKDQPKTPETYRKAPLCSTRMNLGMYQGSEEQSQAALREACSRATITNRDALPDCIRRDKKWTRKVYKRQIPPWDPRLYRRLLWID